MSNRGDEGELPIRRVLAVAAHPDDIEILCAGTMARYAQMGCEIVLCNATSGDRGSVDGPTEEIARIRDQEARRSAALLGATYMCLGFHDCELPADDLEARLRFVDLIRETRPDIVFTHHPGDYHADHVATSKLTFDASFMAAVPLLRTGVAASSKVLPVYYMDTLAGQSFLPEEYVDISGVLELKKQMLSQHQSQVAWMREHDGLDVIDFMLTHSRFRGYQCGVAYAEGFQRAHTWLRPTPNRLLP